MKEVSKYQCERCGAVFDSEEGARECEQVHLKPKSAKGYRYRALKKYPDAIRLTFEDGSVADYVFDREWP